MRIVVKLGTSVLTAGTARLNRPILVEIAKQIDRLKQQNHQVVLVSSGAIAAGRERLAERNIVASSKGTNSGGHESTRTVETLSQKQVLAALGQVHLMSVWQQTFDLYNINIGQMLLTRADLDDRERFLNARDTLDGLLEAGVLPIVNENDAVATAEIKVGDNDNLSASVAVLAGADLLILLTDQPGLMTANPATDPSATLIEEVQVIDDRLRQLAGGSVSGLGTGGMSTKLQAAQTARSSGVDVVISGIRSDRFLEAAAERQGKHTYIPKTATRLESRKQWILAGPSSSGRLMLDDGAVAAVVENKRSLLAKGILHAEGNFARGEVVSLRDSQNQEIARGIVRYPHDDLQKICGLHSNEIEAKLGYHLGNAVVHRDELVLI